MNTRQGIGAQLVILDVRPNPPIGTFSLVMRISVDYLTLSEAAPHLQLSGQLEFSCSLPLADSVTPYRSRLYFVSVPLPCDSSRPETDTRPPLCGSLPAVRIGLRPVPSRTRCPL